jgi:hypothetical protein
VGNLDQQTGAVTALSIGVQAAPMGKACEGLRPERHGFMA